MTVDRSGKPNNLSDNKNMSLNQEAIFKVGYLMKNIFLPFLTL